MTRIISGAAGGRTLLTPQGAATRPTSDRVREAVFSRLEHQQLLTGAHVLDLYAGSGALGLEAASRGAELVLLVESNRKAVSIIRANVQTVGRPGVRVVADAALRVLVAGPPSGIRMDLVLIDPPYEVGEEVLTEVLDALVTRDWLGRDACVVIERATRSPQPTWPDGLELAAQKRYGETTVWFAEPSPPVGSRRL